MNQKEIKVIFAPTEKDPFLIIEKPAGLPSAPLKAEDECAVTQAEKLFPEIKKVHGKKEIERGLVHRIDTETSGLLVIASTQESYGFLTELQSAGGFTKWYRAKTDRIKDELQTENFFMEGFPPCPYKFTDFTENSFVKVESFFRAFGKKGREVRPVTENSGRSARKSCTEKLYKTEIRLLDDGNVLCRITEGFRHQVRCHLSWCGFPVKGDILYNPLYRSKTNGIEENCMPKMEFNAVKVSFIHPVTEKRIEFEI